MPEIADIDDLRKRMSGLESRISAARERLIVNGTVHEDHSATLDELTKHYEHLQQQLHNETVDLEAHGVHVDSFEKTLLNWINGLTLNH